jgi:Predicted transcriptional regulators
MAKVNIKEKVGERIRYYRKINNLSHIGLGLAAGINIAHLGQIELGRKAVTIVTLDKICKVLDVSISELLNFEPKKTKKNNVYINKIISAINKMSPDEAEKVADIFMQIINLVHVK